jgi:hypothetical protein
MQTVRPVAELSQEQQQIELAKKREERVLFFNEQLKKMVTDLHKFVPPTYFESNWEKFEAYLNGSDLTMVTRMTRYRVFFEALKVVSAISSKILNSYQTNPTPAINLEKMEILADIKLYPTHFTVQPVYQDGICLDVSKLQVDHFDSFVNKTLLTGIIAAAKTHNIVNLVLKSVDRFIEEIDKKITAVCCFTNVLRAEVINEASVLSNFSEDASELGMDMEKFDQVITFAQDSKNITLRKEETLTFLKNFVYAADCHIYILEMIASDRDEVNRLIELKDKEATAPFNQAIIEILQVQQGDGWLDINEMCLLFKVYFTEAQDKQLIAERIGDMQKNKQEAINYFAKVDDMPTLVYEYKFQQQLFSMYINNLKPNPIQPTIAEQKTMFAYQAISPLLATPVSHSPGYLPTGLMDSLSPERLEELNQDLIRGNDERVATDAYNLQLQATQRTILEMTDLNKKMQADYQDLIARYTVPPRKKFQQVIQSINELAWRLDELKVEDKPYSAENAAAVQATYNLAKELHDQLANNLLKIEGEFKYLSQEEGNRKRAEINKAKKELKAELARKKEAEEEEKRRLLEEEEERREAEEARLEALEEARLAALEQQRLADLEQARLDKIEQKRLEKIRQQELEAKRLADLEQAKLAEIERARLAKIEQEKQVALEKQKQEILRRAEAKRKHQEAVAKRRAVKLAKVQAAHARKMAAAEQARKLAAEKEAQKLAEIENARKQAEAEKLAERERERAEQVLMTQAELEQIQLGLQRLQIFQLEPTPVPAAPNLHISPPVEEAADLIRSQSAPQSITLKNLPIGVFHTPTTSPWHSASPFAFFAGSYSDGIGLLSNLRQQSGASSIDSVSPRVTPPVMAQSDGIMQSSPAPRELGMRRQ